METELNGLLPFSRLLVTLAEQGIQRRVLSGQLLEFIKEVAPAWLDIVTLGVASATVNTIEEGSKLVRSTFSQENVFVQFTNTLSKLAKKRPIIAFVDDLHWADASSLSLLFHLARNLENHAVLFVCTYRPVAAMESSRNAPLFRDIRANLIRHGAKELELRQGIDVAKYVAKRYPLNTFSSAVISHIQELSDGHALFVDELFSLWQETSVVVYTPTPDKGQAVWALSQEAEVFYTIPQTVSEVLAERLRLMEDDLRETLNCASIEGDDFTVQVIIHLHRLGEDNIYDSLEKLERRYRLVQELGPKEVNSTILDFYRFVHRFYREYIYGQLSAGKRRKLHRQVGECLEKLYNDRHEIAGRLALHFQEAHELLKSIQYALVAAQSEHLHYAWSEGEQWCAFGLRLVDRLPSDPELKLIQLDLLEQSGDGYYQVGEYSLAKQMYHEALNLAQELRVNITRIVRLYSKLGDTCEFEGQLDKSVAHYERALQILEEHNIPFSELHLSLKADYAFMQDRQGHTALALESLHELLTDVEKLPNTLTLQNILVGIYNYLGIGFGNLGRYADALVSYKKAIDLAVGVDNKRLTATCWLNMADECLKMGDLEQCATCAVQGLEIARQIGDLDSVAYAYAIKGASLLAQIKPTEAAYELREAIALSEKSGALWNMSYMYGDLAIAYLMLSDTETAYQMAEHAVFYAEKGSYQLELGYALDALARVEAAQEDWESAEQHFSQAIAIFEKQGYAHFEARTKRHFAEALLRRGEREKAIDALQLLLSKFQKLRLENEVKETQRLLDDSRSQVL